MNENDMTFEEGIARLKTIAEELENGNLNLNESVAKFEEGVQLSKKCSELLENAEKRITILLKDGSSIVEQNFNGQDG